MDFYDELDRLKYYLTVVFISALIGLVFIAGGTILGGITVANRLLLERASVRSILRVAGSGIALQLAGVVIWKIGVVAALYSVLYRQFNATMYRNVDSDNVKASIRMVMRDRVDDIQTEFTELRRMLKQHDQNDR